MYGGRFKLQVLSYAKGGPSATRPAKGAKGLQRATNADNQIEQLNVADFLPNSFFRGVEPTKSEFHR